MKLKKFAGLLLIPALCLPFTAVACNTTEKDTDPDKDKKTTQPSIQTSLDNSFHIQPIADYFKYNDRTNELFKFKNKDGNISKIEFKNLVRNEFINRHFDFDFETFKNILIKDIKIDKEYVNNLKWKFDFHNIAIDPSNIHDVIIPIKIMLPANVQNNSKKLFTEYKINFKLHNIKLSKSDLNAYKKIDELNNLLKKSITSESIKVDLNDNYKELLSKFLEKWDIKDLSTTQLNKIFKISGFDLNELKKQYPDQEINVFVDGIDLLRNNDLNKMTISIRVANGIVEHDKKTNKPTLESRKNVGYTIYKEISLNEQQSADFLTQKLNENVFYSIKENNIYNTNFKNLKAEDFKLKCLIKDAKLELVSYTAKDLRNGVLKLKITLNNKTYEINKRVGTGAYANPFETNFVEQNVNAYNFIIDTLTHEDVSKVNDSVYSIFGTQMLSGGYDSTRAVYTTKNDIPIALHVGEDYLAPSYQAIVAPYNGEIMGIFSREQNPALKNDAQAVGTTLLMRVKKSELNLTPAEYEKHFQVKDNNLDDYMYIGFIHLDANRTINNQELGVEPHQYTAGKSDGFVVAKDVDAKRPKAVTKGQVIGYLGTPDTNGGWMPHVHITVYNNSDKYWNDNGFYVTMRKRDTRFNTFDLTKNPNPFTSIRVDGVTIKVNPNPDKSAFVVDPITGEFDKKNKQKQGTFTWISNPMQDQEKRNGFVNPNVLFKIRGDESFSFDLEELFELQNK